MPIPPIALALMLSAALAGGPESAQTAAAPVAGPGILLAAEGVTPTVEVSWTTRDGGRVSLSGPREFLTPGDKTPLGRNVDAYAAIGGTRYEKGQGHPRGQLLRVGLYKRDAQRLFFDDIAESATITITLRGVRMNQPVAESRGPGGAGTALAHLKFGIADLEACGLDPAARNCYLTADPADPVQEVITRDSGRWGALAGKGPGEGSVRVAEEPDGTLGVTWELPYVLLRHPRDPYQRTAPGQFFEPPHFHVEIEVIPRDAAAQDQTRAPSPTAAPARP